MNIQRAITMVPSSDYICLLFLWCMPYVNVVYSDDTSSPLSEVQLSAKFLTPDKELDPEIRSCFLSNGLPVACTIVEVCAKHGLLTQKIDLRVQYKLDSNSSVPRLFFLEPEGLYVQEELWPLDNTNPGACMQRGVFVRDDTQDKLSPIEIEVIFSTNLLGQTEQNTKHSKDKITLKRNCGSDDVCVPNLKLDLVPNIPTYLIGSYQLIELGVAVSNTGEDAFQSFVEISIPEDVKFVNVKMLTNPPILCLLKENSLVCDVGNPLRANTTVQFVTQFEPVVREGMASKFVFDATVNSTNAGESDSSKVEKQATVDVEVSCKLQLQGTSKPQNVTVKKSDYEGDITYVSQVGPELIHSYSINNVGVTNITAIDLRIILLNATLEGKNLLYIVKSPATKGNVKCDYDSANPQNYKFKDNEDTDTEDEEEESDDSESKSKSRRQIGLIQPNIAIVEAGILSQCQSNQCVSIKCSIKNLQSSEKAKIDLKTRVQARTLKNVDASSESIASVLLAQITKIPYLDSPQHKEIYNKQIVSTIEIN